MMSITINMSDYIIEMGNRFFNIEESDWIVAQDDLDYEETMKEGINGYVLNFEEKANGFWALLWSYLLILSTHITSFLSKKEVKSSNKIKPKTNQGKYLDRNAQDFIQDKVRSRILEVINEDVHLWNEHQNKNKTKIKAKSVIKNPLKKIEPVKVNTFNQTYKAKTRSILAIIFRKFDKSIGKRHKGYFKKEARI